MRDAASAKCMLHEHHSCLQWVVKYSIGCAALHEPAKVTSKQQHCGNTCSPKADINSSRTVLLGVTSNSCVRYAMRMLSLALMTLPASGCKAPVMICSCVVFPAPFTPTRPTFSPFLTSQETSFRTCWFLNVIEICTAKGLYCEHKGCWCLLSLPVLHTSAASLIRSLDAPFLYGAAA